MKTRASIKRVHLVVGQDGVSTGYVYGKKRAAKAEAERLNSMSVPKSRKKERLLEFARLAIRRPFVVLPFGAIHFTRKRGKA